MTEDRLKQIEALCSAPGLSPGPWFVHPNGGICYGDPNDDSDNYPLDNPEDDDLMAASRMAIPELVAEVRRLKAAPVPFRGVLDGITAADVYGVQV